MVEWTVQMAQIVSTTAAAIATENIVYVLDAHNVIYTTMPAPIMYVGSGRDNLANQGNGAGILYSGLGNEPFKSATSRTLATAKTATTSSTAGGGNDYFNSNSKCA